MPYVQKIEKYLVKSRVSGEMDDVVDTRTKLLPLDFYPDGSVVFIEDEKSAFLVRSRKRVVLVPDEIKS